MCETDTGAEITRERAGTRGERERIARRAKVPSKHGTGMTRNSAAAGASAFQGNVMRCEAINAPSTRLDLRLHRHGALFRRVHCSPLLTHVYSCCQPVRFHFGLPDGYSPR